jgi:hypothetical protein
MKIDCIRMAKYEYDCNYENSTKEVLMARAELTEWEYDDFVVKNFKDKYLISNLCHYFLMSRSRMEVMLEDGYLFDVWNEGERTQGRVPNYIKVIYRKNKNLSLWRMTENDEYLWNISEKLQTRLIEERIKYFEKLYGDNFSEIFGNKKVTHPQQKQDAHEWDYLLYTLIKRRIACEESEQHT